MKKIWSWIKDKYNRFNDWVASWAPGLKTGIVAALGSIGSFAAVLQDYVTGLPLSSFISATQIAIITAVLFSLTFWFRMIANRA